MAEKEKTDQPPQAPAEQLDPADLIDMAQGPRARSKRARVEPLPDHVSVPVDHVPAKEQPMAADVLPPKVVLPSRGKENTKPPDGGAIVAQALAGNLGSAPEFLQVQKIDERKMAVLNDYLATAYGYLAYRGYKDGVRFWQWFVDWELTSSQGIQGLARRHILQALLNARGGSLPDIVPRPNILARNLWARQWKEDAYRQGKVTSEDQAGE